MSPDLVVLIDAKSTVGTARFARRAVMWIRGRPRGGESPYLLLSGEPAADL
jgi:hypothetical protein